jgi:ribonuclease HI
LLGRGILTQMQGPKKVYVDGSFMNNEVRWAYLVYEQDNTLIQSAAGVLPNNADTLSGRQVAGELEAVKQAVKWAIDNHVIIDIYYDYTGIYNWVSDFFDSSSKPWATNKYYNQDYRNYIEQYKSKIRSFIKVKAHSGDKANSLADKLARNGISSLKVEKKTDSNRKIPKGDKIATLTGFNEYLDLNGISLTEKQKRFFKNFNKYFKTSNVVWKKK